MSNAAFALQTTAKRSSNTKKSTLTVPTLMVQHGTKFSTAMAMAFKPSKMWKAPSLKAKPMAKVMALFRVKRAVRTLRLHRRSLQRSSALLKKQKAPMRSMKTPRTQKVRCACAKPVAADTDSMVSHFFQPTQRGPRSSSIKRVSSLYCARIAQDQRAYSFMAVSRRDRRSQLWSTDGCSARHHDFQKGHAGASQRTRRSQKLAFRFLFIISHVDIIT